MLEAQEYCPRENSSILKSVMDSLYEFIQEVDVEATWEVLSFKSDCFRVRRVVLSLNWT